MRKEKNECASEESLPKKKIFISCKIKKIKKWTPAEDALLLKFAKRFSYRNWKKISSHLPGRTDIQCSARYKRIRPEISKGSWTVEEDEMLLGLLSKFGKNWSLISQYMSNRSGKQIRDRFLNALDPNLSKDKFTPEEDSKIMKLYESHGTCWSKIAKYLPRRTGDMIKNRFYSSLRRKIHGEDYRSSLLKKRERKTIDKSQKKKIREKRGSMKKKRKLVMIGKKSKSYSKKNRDVQDSDTTNRVPVVSIIPIKNANNSTSSSFQNNNINSNSILNMNNSLRDTIHNTMLTSEHLFNLIKALIDQQDQGLSDSRQFLETQRDLLRQLHCLTKMRLESAKNEYIQNAK